MHIKYFIYGRLECVQCVRVCVRVLMLCVLQKAAAAAATPKRPSNWEHLRFLQRAHNFSQLSLLLCLAAV